MGLFDKKYCDICGEKIGFLGNRKLADGNMCKNCAKLISPYLTGRKEFTVAEMKEHLAYRAENQQKLEQFSPTRTIGTYSKLYIDDANGVWLVSRDQNYKDDNPDIIKFEQVTGSSVGINEHRNETKMRRADGTEVSYNPPHYEYTYDFDVVVYVNSPWFSEISMRINYMTVNGQHSTEYNRAEREANEINNAITSLHTEARAAAAEAAKPRASIKCPYCGAVVVPDKNGKCEFCGSVIQV